MKNSKAKNKKEEYKFTFIDLFAGIGGFRLGMEQAGGKCVFSSEWNKFSQKTYQANFGDIPSGDITQIKAGDIPEFDILCAGFPCQAFSVAGKRRGFEDTRGTLFYDVSRIIEYKKPKAFLLENVKGLLSHDGGNTFEVIKNTLEGIGYTINYKILNSKNFGLPQSRERIFIVGFLNSAINFTFPTGSNQIPHISSILEKRVKPKFLLNDYVNNTTLSDLKQVALDLSQFSSLNPRDYKADKRKQIILKKIYEGRSNIKTPLIIDAANSNILWSGLCGTLTTSVGGSSLAGFKVLQKKKRKNKVFFEIRKLTPRECARLQGFPDAFKIPVSDNQAYIQFGNSVSVPVIKALAMNILASLQELDKIESNEEILPFKQQKAI